MERPGRPFGVSLAIVVSVFLFTVLPLAQIGGILLVRQHFLNLQFEDQGLTPIAIGGDFLGVAESTLVLQGALSLAFLFIGVLAWRGRPSSVRFILVCAVLGLTVLKLITVVSQRLAEPDMQGGVSSFDSIMQSVATGQFVIEVLVMLYVIWYMNRAPARAFYRGYYLSDANNISVADKSDDK